MVSSHTLLGMWLLSHAGITWQQNVPFKGIAYRKKIFGVLIQGFPEMISLRTIDEKAAVIQRMT